MHAFIYTFLIVLYIMTIFVPNALLAYTVGAVSVMTVLLSGLYARGLYFYTGLLFLGGGIFLFLRNGLPWYAFFLQFQSMLGLLSLFLVLPFMNALIYVHHFDKTIEQLLLQKIKHWAQLYQRSSLANQLIGNFLNIATIPFIVKSLRSSLDGFPRSEINKFCSRSILRSYALALTWSPMEVMVSKSIDITGAPYLVILPIMICLAAGAIWIDFKLASFGYRKISYASETAAANLKTDAGDKRSFSNDTNDKRKLGKLLLFLIFFIGAVTFVQIALHQSFLLSVVLVLPFYCILWSLLLGKSRRYVVLLTGKWKKHTFGLSNYFFMFLSAGLFVRMVAETGWLVRLQIFYQQFVEVPFYFYLLTAAFFLSASLIGFHPLVAITIFTVILGSMINDLSPIPFTVVLIACSLSTVMYSPFNLSVSLLANDLNVNPFHITRWNIAFALFYIFLSIIAATLLDFII